MHIYIKGVFFFTCSDIVDEVYLTEDLEDNSNNLDGCTISIQRSIITTPSNNNMVSTIIQSSYNERMYYCCVRTFNYDDVFAVEKFSLSHSYFFSDNYDITAIAQSHVFM